VHEKSRYITREFRKADVFSVSALISTVFHDCIRQYYLPEGVDNFLTLIDPLKLEDRLDNGQYGFVAETETEIVGMILIRNTNHITLLFVDRQYHHMGIGKTLFSHAYDSVFRGNPNVEKMTVNSSPYAVGFYSAMGFTETAPAHYKDGMKIIPMELLP
jgi:ribosomal protein S18 acetylase RimI-like enzyme